MLVSRVVLFDLLILLTPLRRMQSRLTRRRFCVVSEDEVKVVSVQKAVLLGRDDQCFP